MEESYKRLSFEIFKKHFNCSDFDRFDKCFVCCGFKSLADAQDSFGKNMKSTYVFIENCIFDMTHLVKSNRTVYLVQVETCIEDEIGETETFPFYSKESAIAKIVELRDSVISGEVFNGRPYKFDNPSVKRRKNPLHFWAETIDVAGDYFYALIEEKEIED